MAPLTRPKDIAGPARVSDGEVGHCEVDRAGIPVELNSMGTSRNTPAHGDGERITMDDRAWVLEQIEQAQRDHPVCEACSAPTVPVPYDGGSIWLECSSLQQRRGPVQRLLGLEFLAGHTRRRIADAAQLRTAA